MCWPFSTGSLSPLCLAWWHGDPKRSEPAGFHVPSRSQHTPAFPWWIRECIVPGEHLHRMLSDMGVWWSFLGVLFWHEVAAELSAGDILGGWPPKHNSHGHRTKLGDCHLLSELWLVKVTAQGYSVTVNFHGWSWKTLIHYYLIQVPGRQLREALAVNHSSWFVHIGTPREDHARSFELTMSRSKKIAICIPIHFRPRILWRLVGCRLYDLFFYF